MGLLGLRKFIDSCGCTRLLPVPISDAEAEEETLRRLRVEGYHEVVDDNGSASATGGHDGSHRRRLTSSIHALNSAAAATAVGHAAASASQATTAPMVDHVLVDMNCIVHSCFHHQNSENKTKKQLIQDVLERLRVLVTEVVVPRQSLSICFDGPAPVAKLQTQRLRRRKVSLLDTGSAQQLSTLSITAGSLFMIELENAIASQFKLNHGRGFLRRTCPVYLYGTTVMGEGEAKISRALAFLAYGSHGSAATDGSDGSSNSHPRGGSQQHQQWRRGGGGGRGGGTNGHAASHAQTRSRYGHYNPDDTIVVLGNDIDLVVTCLGATAYHNLSIISPSSLQLIRVSDIIYRWLKATSATRGDTPFSPSQLPSIRIDFIYLFLLNGGDHYVGAGEVAMGLWKRYRTVRAAYPYSSLVSPSLDAIDTDFLADVVQAADYTGSSSVEVGMNLLQSALWSLYTVVTGVCPDYNYVPEPEAPQLCHLRAAAAHCQRTHRRIRLADFKTDSQPLAPLETYVALMPTEATLPKSVAAGLRSKAAHQSILKTLETSNDTLMVARAAKDAVEVSAPFLTTSEQYLRHFTAPVQLNIIPPRRRLNRHEQHRMMATQGHIQVEDPVPVVAPIAMAEEVPYMSVPYPAHTTCLDFYCPLDASVEAHNDEDGAGGGAGAHHSAKDGSNHAQRGNGGTVAYVQGRVVSTRPSLHGSAVTAAAPGGRGPASSPPPPHGSADGVEHRRVYLRQEEAAREVQARERQSAAAKLQRTLDVTSGLLQRGKQLSPAEERRMRRRLHRLQAAESEELRSTLAKEERKYAARSKTDSAELEEELRRFLGDDADVAALLSNKNNNSSSKGSKANGSKKNGTKKKKMKGSSAEEAAASTTHKTYEEEEGEVRPGKKRARGHSTDSRENGGRPSSSSAAADAQSASGISLHTSSEWPEFSPSQRDTQFRRQPLKSKKQRRQ